MHTNKTHPEIVAHFDENVFGFDVSVEDAVPVHVVDGLAQLVHVQLHLLLTEVGLAICCGRQHK